MNACQQLQQNNTLTTVYSANEKRMYAENEDYANLFQFFTNFSYNRYGQQTNIWYWMDNFCGKSGWTNSFGILDQFEWVGLVSGVRSNENFFMLSNEVLHTKNFFLRPRSNPKISKKNFLLGIRFCNYKYMEFYVFPL